MRDKVSGVLHRFMRKVSLLFTVIRCFALTVIVCVTSCVTTPIPSPELPRITREQVSDAELLAQIREQWYIMANPAKQDDLMKAMTKYNQALDLLVRRIRYDHFGKPSHRFSAKKYGFELAHNDELDPNILQAYEDLVPCADIDLDDLETRYTVTGPGIPLAGVVPADKAKDLKSVRVMRDKGNVHSLTAVLVFPKNPHSKQLPKMCLIPRLSREDIPIGRYRYPLAADFSAPLALYWQMTDVKSMRLLGLFRPLKAVNVYGLSFNEPYNPKKIPVVLTHGLMSSPNTFSKLVNRLVQDPEIRKNYQFWYFGYPTGIPWVISAEQYREALTKVRHELDPHKRNKNWDRMVVLGHSMGGLITRYSLAKEPWKLMKDTLSAEGERELMKAQQAEKHVTVSNQDNEDNLHRALYFKPLQEPKRVIYLATPHRGAPFADNWISAIGSWLIKIPVQLTTEALKIVTFQEDMFLVNPQNFVHNMTSINQLSPQSVTIKNLSSVPLRNVPTHSVIGNQGDENPLHSSDGIVPYWSSHLNWSDSEKIVHHDHSVQDDSETANEIIRILKLHLSEKGR